MPYEHLLPSDLSIITSDDLQAKYREFGYRIDALRGEHTTDADMQRMRLDLARERIRQELRHRNGHGG